MFISAMIRTLPALLAILYLACPYAAHGEIVSAMLYPDSAQVLEQATPALGRDIDGQRGATFSLPPQADPQTVSVRLLQEQGRITDLSWRRTLREDKERVKALRERIDALTVERNAHESRRLALDAAVGFWRGLDMEGAATPQAASNMASAVAGNVERLHAEMFATAKRIEEMDRRLEQLKAELEQARGGSREVWEITLRVSGVEGSNLPLEFSYTMADSGWRPVYRVNALPDRKRIDIAMEARIWQRSGQDWRNARISLATLPPHGPIAPPDMSPWVIQPMPSMRPMPEPRAGKMLTREMLAADMAESTTVVERATYRVWDLGRQSLPTGPEQRVRIGEHVLGADFTYLVRPSQGERAYLRAEAAAKEALDLPPGEALLMVDGGILAKTGFSFAGTESAIFFGGDPLVTAETQLLERQGGERGIIGRKGTHAWRWRITVANAKGYPVDVRVEEPRPQVRDERIKTTYQFEPEPVADPEEPWLIVWRLAVPSNSRKAVTWGVRLEAPADMELDLGWR